MEEDDFHIISLTCRDCDFVECNIGRKIFPIDSKEGCTRKVPEDLFIDYEHWINEELPFMRQIKTKEGLDKTYINIMDVLYKVYKCPLNKKIGSNGKILFSDEWN